MTVAWGRTGIAPRITGPRQSPLGKPINRVGHSDRGMVMFLGLLRQTGIEAVWDVRRLS